MSEIDVNAQVSHEQDGRVLTGTGVSADALAETMDRHTPPEPAAPAGPAVAPSAEGGVAAPAVPPTRGRQRFADLTREREEARAEAATAKAERDALKAEVEQARLARTAPAREEPPPVAAKPEPTRPKPTEDEIGTKYQTYADFTEDLAEWKWEQKQAASDPSQQIREILAQERAAAQFRTAIDSAQERGRKKYPDFDALLKSPAGAINLSRDDAEAVQRVAFIASHPQSEDIQYAILKDPALAQRLHDMDALTFGVTIAGLVPAVKPAAAAFTPPPPPHPTVGAASPTIAKSAAELAEKGYDFDASGYREKRAAERATFRRR